MSDARPRSRTEREPDASSVDASLLAAIATGDGDAFGALWERYRRPTYALCLAIVGDRALAEDAVQEAFVRIWRGAGSYDPSRGAPAAWVMTVTRNVARSAARRRPAALDHERTPARDVESAALDRVWLREALGALSPPEQVAIELAYFADLSHAQVAERLGEPLGTVKARIRRALVRLGERAGR